MSNKLEYHYSKIHDDFKLNGKHFSLFKAKNTFEDDILNFLKLWQNNDAFIINKTSGSTGIPKSIKVSKQAMVNSAIATGTYFNLQKKNKALICLPANYIAGKMMLVRAMVLGLEMDCIAPKGNLNIDQAISYTFAAMVPLQLKNNLSKLTNIKHLIVGGAKVSIALINSLQNLDTKVYETYGMTETVSHIAIKPLNTLSKSNYFSTLPNVTITQDKRDCLVIKVPNILNEKITTNDIVKLHSVTQFEWLGRYDNVINSGGIKIHPEQIENQLATKIKARFFIASEKDEQLGNIVILIVEGENTIIDTSLFNELDTYSKPKKTYYLKAFAETESGKIQRKKTLELL